MSRIVIMSMIAYDVISNLIKPKSMHTPKYKRNWIYQPDDPISFKSSPTSLEKTDTMNKDEIPYYKLHDKPTEESNMTAIQFNKDKWKEYLNTHTSSKLVTIVYNNPLHNNFMYNYEGKNNFIFLKDIFENNEFNPLLNKEDSILFLLLGLCIKEFTIPIKPKKTVVGLKALEALFEGKTLKGFEGIYKVKENKIYTKKYNSERYVLFTDIHTLLTNKFQVIDND